MGIILKTSSYLATIEQGVDSAKVGGEIFHLLDQDFLHRILVLRAESTKEIGMSCFVIVGHLLFHWQNHQHSNASRGYRTSF